MPPYSDPQYWEERYLAQPVAFDWYQGYGGFRKIIVEHAPPDKTDSLLHLGVGTSVIQENMVRQDGYKSITNIDISNYVIGHMKELHNGIPQLTYKVADCRDMSETFQNEAFDCILDKGTIDALMCGDGCANEIYKVLKECFRVLKPFGSMIIITYGDPGTRLHYLEGDPSIHWEVQVYVIQKVVEGASISDAAPGPSIIRGPFSTTNLDAMDSLSDLENVHFAYCMKKVVA
eukprot:gene18521-25025_t